MKTIFRFVRYFILSCPALTLALVLCAGLCVPGRALADDDDFTFEYSVTPTALGYRGGFATLKLRINNRSATKTITKFLAQIAPNDVFKYTWDTNIAPGGSQTVSCTVPFEQDDLDKELLLAVSIYNDSDANPDGLRTAKFEIESVMHIFSVKTEFLPDKDEYRPGDRITVRFTLRNEISGISAANVVADIHMNHYDSTSENIVYDPDPVEYGEIMPYSERVYSFEYTVMPDDTDCLLTYYEYEFDMMGKHYSYGSGDYCSVRAYDIAFTAVLSADSPAVESGGTVEFGLSVQNTGTEEISRIRVYAQEGGEVAASGPLAPGATQTFSISRAAAVSGDTSYIVEGATGNQARRVTTNAVSVTVAEPATPSPAPSPTPSPTPAASPTAAPSAAPSPGPRATQAALSSRTDAGFPRWLIPLLAILAAVAAAAAAAIMVILAKRRTRRNEHSTKGIDGGC